MKTTYRINSATLGYSFLELVTDTVEPPFVQFYEYGNLEYPITTARLHEGEILEMLKVLEAMMANSQEIEAKITHRIYSEALGYCLFEFVQENKWRLILKIYERGNYIPVAKALIYRQELPDMIKALRSMISSRTEPVYPPPISDRTTDMAIIWRQERERRKAERRKRGWLGRIASFFVD